MELIHKLQRAGPEFAGKSYMETDNSYCENLSNGAGMPTQSLPKRCKND